MNILAVDRYNDKDITLEDNMRYLRNHVYDVAENIYRYLEMNKRIFRKFDVNGKVFSTYKAYRDWETYALI